MKTSIFVSSIASFFLLITLGGAPTHNHREMTNQISDDNIAIYTTNMLPLTTVTAPATTKYKKAELVTPSTSSEDFSYLKFNVADYTETEDVISDSPIELPVDEYDYSYLKFNVADYMEGEFDYLKFDVSKFTDNSNLNSYETIELPVTNIEYLKFDVNNFMDSSETGSDEISELPADEFEYLKFDVNEFYNAASASSEGDNLLPIAE